MTATTANTTTIRPAAHGVFLIRSERGTLPFGNSQGRPTTRWTNNYYSDGTVLYVCTTCDKGYATPAQVFGHLKAHSSRTEAAPLKATADLTATVAGLVEAAASAQAQRVRDERDAWKARALAAEKNLAALRRILAP